MLILEACREITHHTQAHGQVHINADTHINKLLNKGDWTILDFFHWDKELISLNF